MFCIQKESGFADIRGSVTRDVNFGSLKLEVELTVEDDPEMSAGPGSDTRQEHAGSDGLVLGGAILERRRRGAGSAGVEMLAI